MSYRVLAAPQRRRSAVSPPFFLLVPFLLLQLERAGAQPSASGEVLPPSTRGIPWPLRRRVGIRVLGLTEPLGPTVSGAYGLGPRRDPPISRAELRDLGLRPRGLGLTDPTRWPSEPATPDELRASKLADVLAHVCDLSVDAKRRGRYGRWVLRYSAEFGVDAMLLAAVIAQQSRCRAFKRNSYGLGLGMLNYGMYARALRGARYRHGVRQRGRWLPQQLELDRFRFDRMNLLSAEPNIYFTAAFLSVWQRQCPAVDRPTHSVAHRHFVSHFVWGDQIHDAGPEDRILTVRRRLLEYYRGEPHGAARAHLAGVALNCPLDGAPRKVTGVIGDDRDGGQRHHTGIDLDSTTGEPVRAVADGTVILAGVDWGANDLGNLPPHLTRMVADSRMGPRGLLIKLKHRNEIVSIYMHLSAYVVWPGQYVTRGQLIGYVGQTGIKQSPPHLHFELWRGNALVDPLVALRPYLFGPKETYRGQRMAAMQSYRRELREKRKAAPRRPKRRAAKVAPAVPLPVP